MDRSIRLIDDFSYQVQKFESLDQVLSLLSEHVTSLGFERFSYWLIWPPEGPRFPLCVTTYPAAWTEFYIDNDLASEDLVGRYGTVASKPYVWSEVVKKYGSYRSLSQKQRIVFGEGANFGLKAGGTIPLHGPGLAKATFSVSNDEKEIFFEKLFNEKRHELYLIAAYAHNKIVELGLAQAGKKPVFLTSREIEILTWSARGKTAWEISKILYITEDTVRKHLDNLCKKIEAQNKTHAAAIALMNGWIKP